MRIRYPTITIQADGKYPKIATHQSLNVRILLDDVLAFVSSRKAFAKAPASYRLFLLGPAAAGKSALASALAERYNLIHVSPVIVLQAELARMLSTHEANMTILPERREALVAYERDGIGKVPVEVVVELLVEHLAREDCLQHGWILDGFPNNMEQIKLLEAHRINPNRVIYLDTNEDIILAKQQAKLIHPIKPRPPSEEPRESTTPSVLPASISNSGRATPSGRVSRMQGKAGSAGKSADEPHDIKHQTVGALRAAHEALLAGLQDVAMHYSDVVQTLATYKVSWLAGGKAKDTEENTILVQEAEGASPVPYQLSKKYSELPMHNVFEKLQDMLIRNL